MKMNWWIRLLDFLSPRTCVICGNRLAPSERTLCSGCLMQLPRTRFHLHPDDNPMVRLFWHLSPVRRATAFIHFYPHTDTAEIIYRLKYHHHPDAAVDIGRLMASELQPDGFFDGVDLLVPVPLSRKRIRQRGYNQTEQLARGISALTNIPVDTQTLRRQHFHQSQTRLSRFERRENVKDMFVLHDAISLQHKHVLLIDDVCTTGATLIACANAMRQVEGITISVLALGFTTH